MKSTQQLELGSIKLVLSRLASTEADEFLKLTDPDASSDRRYHAKTKAVRALMRMTVAAADVHLRAGQDADRFPASMSWLRWDDPLAPEGVPSPDDPHDVIKLTSFYGAIPKADMDDVQLFAFTRAGAVLLEVINDHSETEGHLFGNYWLAAVQGMATACQIFIDPYAPKKGHDRAEEFVQNFDGALALARSARVQNHPKHHQEHPAYAARLLNR